MPDLTDFDGPLGALEPQLARRRIAVARDAGGRVCLVRPDSVVLEFGERAYGRVRDAIVRRGLDILGTPNGAAPPDEPPTGGAVAARIYPQIERPSPARWRTNYVRELVDDLRSEKLTVRPNQVYLADGVARYFKILDGEGSVGTPGIESTPPVTLESTVKPAAAPLSLPPRLDIPGRRRPNVVVFDTGLRTVKQRVEHPGLTNCVLHEPWLTREDVGRWNDEDEPDDDGRGRLDHQAGHGTFIAGIIRQICPDAVVHTSGVLSSYGDGDDASVIKAIERAERRLGAGIDIAAMSFGAYGAEDQSPSMVRAINRLLRNSVVVASAGNDATSRPYYPAALPGVIGVGALDEGRRAAFSNFGDWVDACAPAVDVVSTFFTEFDDVDPDRGLVNSYRGWASWSGTSFAAPKVAAVIAQEMYLRGGTANDAWSRISSAATFRVPGLGVVINVG